MLQYEYDGEVGRGGRMGSQGKQGGGVDTKVKVEEMWSRGRLKVRAEE